MRKVLKYFDLNLINIEYGFNSFLSISVTFSYIMYLSCKLISLITTFSFFNYILLDLKFFNVFMSLLLTLLVSTSLLMKEKKVSLLGLIIITSLFGWFFPNVGFLMIFFLVVIPYCAMDDIDFNSKLMFLLLGLPKTYEMYENSLWESKPKVKSIEMIRYLNLFIEQYGFVSVYKKLRQSKNIQETKMFYKTLKKDFGTDSELSKEMYETICSEFYEIDFSNGQSGLSRFLDGKTELYRNTDKKLTSIYKKSLIKKEKKHV